MLIILYMHIWHVCINYIQYNAFKYQGEYVELIYYVVLYTFLQWVYILYVYGNYKQCPRCYTDIIA